MQGSWSAPTLAARPKANSTTAAAQTTLDGYVKREAGNSEKDQHERVYQYVESRTALRRGPPVITIDKAGTHEISKGPDGPSRLQLLYSFIDQDDVAWMFEQLKADIPWEERKVVIRGVARDQPRLTAWFGDFPYTYSGLTLRPYQWSPLLEILRDKIAAQTGITFNSMLANLYRDGKDSVDWHSDDEPALGRNPTIASLSFGETRTFELRRKPPPGDLDRGYEFSQHIKVPLPEGSLLLMSGAAQRDWQHRVPKEYHDRAPRINLTFRNINRT